jgi:CheY-like chemotaxis protein
MSATDQPSILAVCVPNGSSDADIASVNEILAARGISGAFPRISGGASSLDCRTHEMGRTNELDSNRTSEKCESCDDSACGMEPLGDSAADSSTIGLTDSRFRGLESVRSDGAQSDLSQLEVSPGCKPSFFHADSGKKALELLRMLRFDLLVTGDQLPDMPVSQLIRRVRAAWPWQKWAMVGSMISPQDEISARTLGAMAVFDAPPDWEVLGSMAAKAAGKADTSPAIRLEAQKSSAMHLSGESPRRKPRQSSNAAGLDRIVLGDAVAERAMRAKSPRRGASVSRRVADRSAG